MNLRRVTASVLASLLLTGLVAASASATSCVAPKGPKATITGNGDFSMGGKFFEHYDGVILGEVVSVDSNPRVPSGGTTIQVDTYGAIGSTTIAPTIMVTADDEGAMNGYPFEQGGSYFIPLQNRGPQGQLNYSFVCDPIGEIAGPDAADRLLALARRNGQEIAVAGEAATESAEPGAPASVGIPARSFAPAAIGVAVAAALGVAVALVLRRRRAST